MKNLTISIIMPIIGIFLGWCFPNFSWASIEVDGIYYELDSLNNTAQVVEGHYHGQIVLWFKSDLSAKRVDMNGGNL